VEHLLGMLVRASATYVFLLILLRVAGKRTIAEGTPFDLVVALVLGDFPDDVIWGEVPVAQGIVAMATVMLAHACVVYASYRSIRFDQLVGSGPTPILRGARALPDGLRVARMNGGDVDVALRLHDIARDDVQEAQLEPTGEVSVLPKPAARRARRRDLTGAA
jgi:uncharacterized membrane protein YcaP (DUF421 family)